MGETRPGERMRRGSIKPRVSLLLGEGELCKDGVVEKSFGVFIAVDEGCLEGL